MFSINSILKPASLPCQLSFILQNVLEIFLSDLLITFPFPIAHELSPVRDPVVRGRAPPPSPPCASPWRLWDGLGWLSQELGGPCLALELDQGLHPLSWVQPCAHTDVQRGQAVVCAGGKPSQVSAGELMSNLQDSGRFFLTVCGVGMAFLSWVFLQVGPSPAGHS